MTIKDEIDRLTSELTVYQDNYYKKGVSLVSDEEYDRLSDRLMALEKEHPELAHPDSPTRRVGSDLTNDFPEVEHTILVLSLDKAYSADSLLDFFNKSIDKVGGALSFAAEEKIDGISMVLYYEDGVLARAVTRGNGLVGNDVTANIQTMPDVPLSLPKPVTLAVRGEVYLDKKDFERLNAAEPDESKRAANPRNLAAGAVRRQKSSEAKLIPLHMWCYEGFWQESSETPADHLAILAELKSLGFRINPNFAFFDTTKEKAEEKLRQAGLEGRAYSFSGIEDFLRHKTEERAGLDYEIDGLVFKIDELAVREEFGYTEHHPRWAIAYKFESPQAQTTLLGITVQVGRTGRITPVAEIAPTKLAGTTIRRATLHNQEYINELELAIGDTISVSRRGDVIPAVEAVIDKNELGNTTYKLPDECPCCHSRLSYSGAHLYCTNPDCPDQVVDRIAFFASRDQMDIETLGPKTVRLFYDNGIYKSVEDIYSTDYRALPELEGIGEKSVELLIKGVEESKRQPFAVVLSSLGVAEIGKKSAQALVDGGYDSAGKLLKASDEEDVEGLTRIPGIGEVTARNLINAFKDERLRATLEALGKAGLSMAAEKKEAAEGLPQVFAGQVWCVTGSFENFNPRSKAMKEVELRGGRTVSSVTGKTTHLLAGKGGGSKRAKAGSLGVTIVTEEEFLSLLGWKTSETGASGQLTLF